MNVRFHPKLLLLAAIVGGCGPTLAPLGAPAHTTATGAATVWSSSEPEDNFGYDVSPAGDVNGDGWADLVVTAPGAGPMDTGAVFVYHGSAAGLSAAPDWSATSSQGGSGFGASAAGAGDVNGDGWDDLLVSAQDHDGGQTDEGRVSLYLGGAGGLEASPAWTLEWNQANAGLAILGGRGDVNGDGYADVLVGTGGWNAGGSDQGRASLYLGGPGGPGSTAAWTVTGAAADDYLGSALAMAGDVDGDGYDDVLVGTLGADGGATGGGGARLYRGGAGGLAALPAWSITGSVAYTWLGRTVAGVGDLDGDGYDDVAVGTSQYSGTASDEGALWVYRGSAGGLATSPSWSTFGGIANAFLGEDVTHADLDGDGYEDLVVGAWGWGDGEAAEGVVQVYAGSAAGPAASPSWTFESDVAGRGLGWRVAGLGDVDGDGVDDLAVGALPGGWGEVSLYLGSASPEVCDGVDNDGDGLVDDADPSLSADTWYPDADADGYGASGGGLRTCTPPVGSVTSSTDCDDGTDTVHPGAFEDCDGVDNDCDGGEDGLVTHVAPDGTRTDWSAAFGAGETGAPARINLPNTGTLAVCRGEYDVNLVAGAGALDLVGHDDYVVLSAGGSGRVLNVASSTAELRIEGVSIQDGAVTTGSGTGGCVRLSAGSLTLVDSDVTYCTAVSGGGIYVAGGSLSLERTFVQSNDATDGAGLYLAGGTVELTDSTIERNDATGRGGGVYSTVAFRTIGVDWEDNHATDGGGLYADLSTGTVSLTDNLFNSNSADNLGGGAYLASGGTLLCAAQPSAADGFLRNTAAVGGGGVYLASASGQLRSRSCDWGTGVSTNNRPSDIRVVGTSYNKGDNATFLCSGGACP